jgi:hypothetical protein
MKMQRMAALSLLIALAWSAPALAAPIKYEFWGTATGEIGATSFFQRAVYFEIYGDTDYASTFGGVNTNGYINYIQPGSAAVTIDGIGTASLQAFMRVLANPNDYCQCLALKPGGSTQGDLFDLFQTPFNLSNPYDLTSSTGLITGTVRVFSTTTVNTSLGALRFNSAYDGSFKATVVPLPATVGLFGTALSALATVRRRRKA